MLHNFIDKVLNANQNGITVTSCSTAPIVAIDQFTCWIEKGYSHYVEKVYPMASTDVIKYIVLDPTSMVNENLRSFPSFWSTTCGDVTINLGTCTAYSGGTEIVPLNRLDGGNPAVVKYYWDVPEANLIDLTFPSDGFDVTLVGTTGTNQSSGGGSLTGKLERILDASLIYVFRISNNSAENIKLGTNIIWFEIPTE